MMVHRPFDNRHIGFSQAELHLLRTYNNPKKIQDYISSLPQNFEEDGPSCLSVREVLKKNKALCLEGALMAALLFWMNGEPPLILDLMANHTDDDHVIALFRVNQHWGAISKSNHASLKYRDPVYKSVRELAMSYVHEYTNHDHKKTLRSISSPYDLSRLDPALWVTGCDAWFVAEALCDVRHTLLFPKTQEKYLRPLEPIEIEASSIVQYKRKSKSRKG